MMNSLLVALAVMVVSTPSAEGDPATKPLVRRFKVASVDAKVGEIKVREADFEVFWDKESTRFYRHRSVKLNELRKGAEIHVLGMCRKPREGEKQGSSETDTIVAFIEHVGAGSAFSQPPITPVNESIRWHAGELHTVVAPFQMRIGDAYYKLLGGEKMAVYVLDDLKPEGITGAAVIIRGNARKVTVGGKAKERQVTRVQATEVHLVELNPAHWKIFQLQWGEKKKDDPPEPKPAEPKQKEKKAR